MFTMDFKGITWVGNIYEKFEAMCLEVEDIITQDPAKYVENQVQNVGGNIRKFCAEVMHDLIPPSSENPDKEKDSDISVEKNAEFRASKKPKLDATDKPKKENAPHNILEAIAPAVNDSNLVSFLNGVPQINHLLPLASVISDKEADPDFSLEQNNSVDKPKKSMLCTKNVIGSLEGESIKVSLPIQVKEENNVIPSSSPSVLQVSGSELNQEHSDYVGNCKKSIVHVGGDCMKKNSPFDASKLISSALKKMQSQNSFEVTVDKSADYGGTIDSCILRQSNRAADVLSVVLCENKAMGIGVTSSSSIVTTEPNVIDTLTTFKAMMESSMESSMDGHEPYDKDAVMTQPAVFVTSDNVDGVEVEASDAVELDMKTIEQFDNVKLDDSCIVVQPFSVSSRERKHRSYKKKIRDAFASRMGTSKKKEYEQLAIWFADLDAGTNQQRVDVSTPSTLSRKMDSMSLSTDEFCESEWEIL